MTDTDPPPNHTRVIGIISAAYCGSTLVSIVLGRARRVLFTSEVFQVVRKGPGAIRCRTCAERCPFWTPEFLGECRDAPDRYDRITDRARTALGCTHVVFKEGDWRVYDTARRIGNRFDDYVLLMKRPAAYAYSCAVHEGLSVAESLDRYARTYRGALGFIERTQAPTCVVFFDAFAEQPAIEAERLCRHVGIPYDDALVELGWQPWMHPLATGNAGAFAHLGSLRDFDAEVERDPYWRRVYQDRHIEWIRREHGRIAPDRKWEEGLSAAQHDEVARHHDANDVFTSMLRLAGTADTSAGAPAPRSP